MPFMRRRTPKNTQSKVSKLIHVDRWDASARDRLNLRSRNCWLQFPQRVLQRKILTVEGTRNNVLFPIVAQQMLAVLTKQIIGDLKGALNGVLLIDEYWIGVSRGVVSQPPIKSSRKKVTHTQVFLCKAKSAFSAFPHTTSLPSFSSHAEEQRMPLAVHWQC
jgi:hypothetical protein